MVRHLEARFDLLNNEIKRPLPIGKKGQKKMIVLIKDELVGEIIKEFAGLKAKLHSQIKDNDEHEKKGKDAKNLLQNKNLNSKVASKIENTIKVFKDDNYNLDKMEEKYTTFLSENNI